MLTEFFFFVDSLFFTPSFYTTACSLFDSDGSVFYGITFEDGEVRESVESDLVAYDACNHPLVPSCLPN